MSPTGSTVAKERTRAPDATVAAAVDSAREALIQVLGEDGFGDHLGCQAEADRVVTHLFASIDPGYVGWRWAVTLARASRSKVVTIDEVVLLPGPEALIAPAWVPWSERVRPEDMGPGALLPTTPDDPRLVPSAYAGIVEEEGDEATDPDRNGGEDEGPEALIGAEVILPRARVLSDEGRVEAAERWYEGSGGPEDPVARAAPAHCSTCGFLVRLRGGLGGLFGVCANEYSPSDGQVVSFDHGCGAHSEVITVDVTDPADQPHPVLDTLGYDDVEGERGDSGSSD